MCFIIHLDIAKICCIFVYFKAFQAKKHIGKHIHAILNMKKLMTKFQF